MARRNDISFQQWVDENNFSEDDLLYIQKTMRNQTLMWLIISCIPGVNLLSLPLFCIAWINYKYIRQRTFNPRQGILLSLFFLVMFITFITIIPAIIFFIASKTYTAGLKGLIKKELVGAGDRSIPYRKQWTRICRVPRIIRILISAAAAAGIFIMFTSDAHYSKDAMFYTVFYFFFFDIIGLIICSIINNIRYKGFLSNFETAGKSQTVDREDPNTWSKDYVSAYKEECISYLQKTIQLVIRYFRQGEYKAVIAGLDRILNGLITMQNSGCGDFRSHIASFSMIEGMTVMLTPDVNEQKQRETASSLFEDARDFFSSQKAKENMSSIIAQLKEETPLTQIIGEDYDPDTILEMLQDLSQKIADAEPASHGGSRPEVFGFAVIVILGLVIAFALLVRSDKKPAWIMMVQEMYYNWKHDMSDVTPSDQEDFVLADGVTEYSGEYSDNKGAEDIPTLSETSAELCGRWRRVELSVSPMETEFQASIMIQYYIFNTDGTFNVQLNKYETQSSASYWECIRDESYQGTYAFDGNNLQFVQEDEPDMVWISTCEIEKNALFIVGSIYAQQDVEVFLRTEEEADPMDYMTALSEYYSRVSGTWYTARREGDEIWRDSYQFNLDGTFVSHSCGYYYVDNADYQERRGWEVIPMGFPSFGGTYIFDGEIIILSYDEDEYYGQSAEIQTITVQIHDEFVEFDGVHYIATDLESVWFDESLDFEERLRLESQKFEELCAALGVNTNP